MSKTPAEMSVARRCAASTTRDGSRVAIRVKVSRLRFSRGKKRYCRSSREQTADSLRRWASLGNWQTLLASIVALAGTLVVAYAGGTAASAPGVTKNTCTYVIVVQTPDASARL
jgi:hypothetical protein